MIRRLSSHRRRRLGNQAWLCGRDKRHAGRTTRHQTQMHVCLYLSLIVTALYLHLHLYLPRQHLHLLDWIRRRYARYEQSMEHRRIYKPQPCASGPTRQCMTDAHPHRADSRLQVIGGRFGAPGQPTDGVGRSLSCGWSWRWSWRCARACSVCLTAAGGVPDVGQHTAGPLLPTYSAPCPLHTAPWQWHRIATERFNWRP